MRAALTHLQTALNQEHKTNATTPLTALAVGVAGDYRFEEVPFVRCLQLQLPEVSHIHLVVPMPCG